MTHPSKPPRPSNESRGALARLFADPRFDALQRRTERRRASLLQLGATALLLAGIGAVIAWPQAPLWLVVVTAVLLLLPFVIATGRLNASVGGITELRTRDLDEVQRAVRDHAYRRAYFASGFATLAFMAATFGYAEGWLPGGVLLVIGAIVLQVWVGAPVHGLAWTLPDVEDDGA
jgi:hypothetical protein